MSHSQQIPEGSREKIESPPSKRVPGLLADPVVRLMAYVSLGLVVLVLATALGVIVTGVASPTGPRSSAERDLMTAAATAQGATGKALVPYVNALVAAGNLSAARVTLAQARGSVSPTESVASLDLAEARLASVENDYAKAVTLADKAMRGFMAERPARIAKANKTDAAALNPGYGADYYDSALVKAFALAKLSRWKDSVAAFDIYIRQSPTASDILIDRGNAKAELKDKTGAEKDFREALRFVPYDEEAKAGLKKIGVAQ